MQRLTRRQRYLKEGEIKLMVPGFNATARWNGHCERFTRFLDFKSVDNFAFFSGDLPEDARPVGSSEANEAFLDNNLDGQLDVISAASDIGQRYYMANFKSDDWGLSTLRGIILVSLSLEEMTALAKAAGIQWFFHGGRGLNLELVEFDQPEP